MPARNLINYTNTNFKGVCAVDPDFALALDKMNEIAKVLGVTVVVTSAFREDTNVRGAIVPPARMSNHLIGHAIDVNLHHNGSYYNSTNINLETPVICDFIEAVKAAGLRWGGDFRRRDVIHFDTGINIHSPEIWQYKYDLIHNYESTTRDRQFRDSTQPERDATAGGAGAVLGRNISGAAPG